MQQHTCHAPPAIMGSPITAVYFRNYPHPANGSYGPELLELLRMLCKQKVEANQIRFRAQTPSLVWTGVGKAAL